MRSIITQPDRRLREKSAVVRLFDSSLTLLCEELEAAMLAGPAGVGIAAPQIGELQRIVIIDCSRAMRPCRNHGCLHMLNPEVIESSGSVLGREGCLSVPDWVGVVPRAKMVRVRYQDLNGVVQTIESKGFEARVIQHEIDHLNGTLFIDRVVSTKDLVRRLQAES